MAHTVAVPRLLQCPPRQRPQTNVSLGHPDSRLSSHVSFFTTLGNCLGRLQQISSQKNKTELEPLCCFVVVVVMVVPPRNDKCLEVEAVLVVVDGSLSLGKSLIALLMYLLSARRQLAGYRCLSSKRLFCRLQKALLSNF